MPLIRLLLLTSLLAMLSFSTFAEEAAENAFTLNTNAFLNEGMLPVLYTCDGKDVSPKLDWTNVPAKTQFFALIFADPEAPNGTFYHWILYNIPKSTTSFDEGIKTLPAGVMVGKNGFGKMQYNGPCPPKGTAHTYFFTLYALDAKLDLPAGAEGKAVMEAIQKHTAGKAELSAVYSRWLK